LASFSIMDYGYGTAHMSPFEKLKLGWLRYRVVRESGEFVLKDVETRNEILILYDARRGPGEYFILENRWRGSSYDAGIPKLGTGCMADGLAVWHIIEDPELYSKIPMAWAGPEEWGRRGIRLIRKNGGAPFDDRFALFDKAGMVISDETRPAKFLWLDGTPTGFKVELLSDAAPELKVRVTVSARVAEE
jgi:hypothetical protein